MEFLIIKTNEVDQNADLIFRKFGFVHSGIEVYLKNPETGEDGWAIEFLDIYSEDRFDSRARKLEALKTYPNFDCVITW